jgi:hypothetical protein
MKWQGRIVLSVAVLSIAVPIVFSCGCNAEDVLTSVRDFSGSLWLLMFSGFWLYHRHRSRKVRHLRHVVPMKERQFNELPAALQTTQLWKEIHDLQTQLAQGEREAEYARTTEAVILIMGIALGILTLAIWIVQRCSVVPHC